LRELELNWVAAGVMVDVIVPSVVRVAIALDYSLEPGSVAATVEAGLATAINQLVGTLKMGGALEIEAIFAALGGVAGAGGIQVEAPAANVEIDRGQIIRAASITIVRRG
jgi:uncharacterized phage protein gp47/JayE